MSFTFERLEVYKRAIQFVKKIKVVSEKLKGKVDYATIDQLRRATLSVPLNIAEGNGRWHKKEKKRFLLIARGSIFEVVPIIQVVSAQELISEQEYKDLYQDLTAMSMMVSNLITAVDQLQR